MINLNSPTIQNLINKVNTNTNGNFFPGDMTYQGSFPSVTTTMGTANMQSPYYPDPMMMASQQQPSSNIADAFNGYYNPYFIFNPQQQNPYYYNQAYNPYLYNQQYVNPYGYNSDMFVGYNPMDSNSVAIMNSAIYNGVSYNKQLETESNVLKKLAKISSTTLGFSQEKTDSMISNYEIKNFLYNEVYCPTDNYSIENFRVTLVDDSGQVLADSANNNGVRNQILSMCDQEVQRAYNDEYMIEALRYNRVIRNNNLYENSINRKADNMDLFQILNSFSSNWVLESENRRLQQSRRKSISKLYDRDNFRNYNKLLSSGDGKIHGGYGYMPGGTPTTPGKEYIGSSFSLDPNTGELHVEVPEIFKNRLDSIKNRTSDEIELMRQKFIQTCKCEEQRESEFL